MVYCRKTQEGNGSATYNYGFSPNKLEGVLIIHSNFDYEILKPAEEGIKGDNWILKMIVKNRDKIGKGVFDNSLAYEV